MPGVELNNVRAEARDGVVYFMDLNRTTLFSLAPSTGLVTWGGTKSASTITAAQTLTVPGIGQTVYCTTDGVIITLPSATASDGTLAGAFYSIVNMASSGGALLVIKSSGTTTQVIVGGGVTSAYLLANTKATQVKGDNVTLVATGSTTWYVMGMTGTWASTT